MALPQPRVDEVVDPDWFRLAAGLPFAAPVVEVAHQLFLFGVDRDDRLTRPEIGGDPTVEIGERACQVFCVRLWFMLSGRGVRGR